MPVTRVVLDTSYIRSIREPELAAIRAKGLLISLASNGLEEAWAASWREKAPRMLLAPLARLSKYVDPLSPVLPHGDLLGRRLTGTNYKARQRALGDFMRPIRALWADVVADRLTTATWERAGEIANRAVDDFAIGVAAERDEIVEYATRLLEEVPTLKELSDSELARYFRRRSPTANTVTASRLDAFYSVLSLQTVRQIRGARPSPNDVEDCGVLMQLAHPVIVLVRDRRLRQLVEESGTIQRPWLRSLGELLTDPLPRGMPWGSNTWKVAREFVRRDRHEVARLEDAVKVELGLT